MQVASARCSQCVHACVTTSPRRLAPLAARFSHGRRKYGREQIDSALRAQSARAAAAAAAAESHAAGRSEKLKSTLCFARFRKKELRRFSSKEQQSEFGCDLSVSSERGMYLHSN